MHENSAGAIFYEVQATFRDAATATRWIDWLKSGHIADVLAGGATTGRVVRLDAPPLTFAAQYTFPSRVVFDAYLRDHAPRLREEGLQRFPPSDVQYARRSGDIL